MGQVLHPLEFERPLVELEAQLEAVRDQVASGDHSRRDEFAKLEEKVARLRRDTYGKLTRYQRVQLSRHFDRPFTLDFIKHIFSNFVEFHGDRAFRDDPAIVGGTARLGDSPVMLVGHQRGRTTQERLTRNFGMANPEGYRKAMRLFYMAERFALPFIDTQGAYPGLEAEERGQAEAIARNLEVMAQLHVPSIAVVIGEGGSGGALALGVTDVILMLENACYSVITPEGCASILWHAGNEDEAPADQVATAAEMLQLTARDLEQQRIIDEVVPEPLGGAHTNHKEAGELLRSALVRHLDALRRLDLSELMERRYKKYRSMGLFTGDS